MNPGTVFCGVICALTLVVSLWVELYALAGPNVSLEQISAPCRDHGGVAQFVPQTKGIFNFEPATVVCRDGKVGRI